MSEDNVSSTTSGESTPPSPPDAGGSFPRSDVGNAERLIARHGKDLRHCAGLGWMIWDGRRWKLDELDEATERAKETIRANLDTVKSGTKRYKFFLRSQNATRIQAMIRMARSDHRIAIAASQLDAHRFLFNCRNGTIDLRMGTLRAHSREDILSKLADVRFDRGAEAPLWKKFLAEITNGDKELMSYLQRVVGYCLTGDVSAHVIFLLYGLGANGKSVLLMIILWLLGDYGCPMAPDLLLAHRNEPHPTGLADLRGRRVVVANEVEQGRRFNESLLKLITGGDKLTARRMRQDFFVFAPTAKIFLAANHLPEVKGTDDGFWRRIHVVPFKVKFEGSRRDPHLAEKLRSEMPGILAWAVEGCLEWQRIGLAPPPAIALEVETYRADSDPLLGFLKACTRDSKNAKTSFKDLYVAYLGWSQQGGENPISKKEFGSNLKARGYQRKLLHGHPHYCGLELGSG